MSDFDRVFLRKSTPVPPPDEDLDDHDVDQLSDDEPPAAGREGLPSSFRMRADWPTSTSWRRVPWCRRST